EAATLALGQRKDAPGRAPPALDSRLAAFGIDQHQLGRTAADVEDQRRAVARFEKPVAAQHRQPGLFLRRDDFEADAGLAPHAFDEMAGVDRPPARLGGDGTDQADAAATQLFGAYGDRGDHAVHRSRAELAHGRHAFAQAHDARDG